MKNTFKTLLMAGTLIGGLMGSSAAIAGGSYGGYGYGYGHGHGGHFGFKYGYRGGHYGHHRGHHRHGGGGKAAAYTILGVGLGYLLFSATQNSKRYDDRYYRAAPPRYVPPPANRPVGYQQRATSGPNCVMTREYTTTVIIGGEERDAYGTACMQPDGSWLQGPAKLVPEFD